MESALYEGEVRHARATPPHRGFSQRLFMVYLDLAELDRVFAGRWLWGVERRAFASFRRADHLGDPALPLDAVVRDLVATRTGHRPTGPIRLLTHLRYAGYVFNPVSIYYCFAPAGALEAVVADVSNTPWNERYSYVLAGAERDGTLSERAAKRFHVSPFLPMDHEYAFDFERPAATLHARIESFSRGRRVFHADLRLERREISGAALASTLVRYPAMTAEVIAAIYWQAFRLRRKGARVFAHPELEATSMEVAL
jgi:uncharacterized protein